MRASTEGTHASRRWLLACSITGAALYPLADIFASTRYPAFSYRDQAVSELFAIGAPTSDLVVPLFTLSSTLLLLFAVGIWMSANGRRVLHWLAAMMALNAVDAALELLPDAHARGGAHVHRPDARHSGDRSLLANGGRARRRRLPGRVPRLHRGWAPSSESS
jgi:hypothetical protein